MDVFVGGLGVRYERLTGVKNDSSFDPAHLKRSSNIY